MANDAWEAWQEEYRFGVLLIFPPDPVASLVNDLRAKYDARSHYYCDAHISLTVPAPRTVAQKEWEALKAATALWRSLRIQYGPLRVCPPVPGVTLAVEPQSELDRLRSEIEEFPPFCHAGPRQWPFSAHMTIAEFVTLERTRQIVEELKPLALSGEFLCSYVSLAVPDDTFRFVESGRLEFGGKARHGGS